MEGKDNIKELFSQKLGNYEAKVNPDLWANISSQVVAGTSTTATAGLSVFAKTAIGLGISAAAITTVVLLTNTSKESITEKPSIEVGKEIPNSKAIQIEPIAEVNIDKSIESPIKKVDIQLIKDTNPNQLPVISSVPETKKTIDFPIATMLTRSASSVKNSESSQPKIVEGVTYGGMTNYGVAPANETELVVEAPAPEIEPIKRYVNTFTPNGDGRNDYFELISEGLTDFSVVVFSPEGEIVYQSNDPSFKWDGRDVRTGDMVKPGTYMYMVSAYDSDGNPFPIYERLTINR